MIVELLGFLPENASKVRRADCHQDLVKRSANNVAVDPNEEFDFEPDIIIVLEHRDDRPMLCMPSLQFQDR
ncbi:hypothetical protein HFO09_09040 [Rhizobium laguerreae]|uniref:hypothetical protein n=1 Tax=Rhizobium laguerreae TaxID=1076926 RepID=UPI001C923EE5|nr:hypothetical protein [Rhizobium laguerreae]MBY3259862.1 hypothetical protein [Rhizobium laguerreae]MBY3282867.1 hypothetical protein [Rhizobium laguerreae]MBY3289221.1 hypothetical protein [Rhizobium laguerreae]